VGSTSQSPIADDRAQPDLKEDLPVELPHLMTFDGFDHLGRLGLRLRQASLEHRGARPDGRRPK
jgi:hypothetical protein